MIRKIPHLLISLSLTLLLGSCGLMELDEDMQSVADMRLSLERAYLMEGDTIDITPVFTPDTVTCNDVYLYASNDTVLSKEEDGRFVGRMEGEATVTAISVSLQKTDSCHIYVLPQWTIDYHDYPHSMVVYADVDVEGRRFDPATMKLSAWVSGELRGVGIMRQYGDVSYMEVRVYGLSDELDEGLPERVSFKVYDSVNHTLLSFPQRLDYDGEAHGTLSDLFKLAIE